MEFVIDMGGVVSSVIGFLIAWVLYGIKSEISDIKTTVKELSKNIERVDKRVVVLETLNEVKNGTTKES